MRPSTSPTAPRRPPGPAETVLHTIDRTVTVSAELDEVVRWCASAESRRCFPGVGDVTGDGTGLFFEVNVRAPGAAPATVSVNEYLKSSWRGSPGHQFRTSQGWTWPNPATALSGHRYPLPARPGQRTP